MLNVGKIEEGFVLDHIPAGRAMYIYKHLGLDRLDCGVAIIKNARSGKMGKKDILKVECPIDTLDLDVLAFIDHNITMCCTATIPAASPQPSGNFRISSTLQTKSVRFTAASTAT